jgi:hypothetical protein
MVVAFSQLLSKSTRETQANIEPEVKIEVEEGSHST